MMSPEQLLNQKCIEPALLNRGLKKQFPDEHSDEIVNRLQDDLFKMISCERIERSVARSKAEYSAMCGLVVVTKKLGKWNTLGYRMNNIDFLHYYETLYLIDINRLELYYDSVLMSLEQAYTILLNNNDDRKSLEKYVIFSNLSKAGYIVQPHRERITNFDIPQINYTKEISTADKCVWRCLYEELKQTTSSGDKSNEDDEIYKRTKQNMLMIGNAIKNQCILKVLNDDESRSVDSEIWSNAAAKSILKNCSRKRRMSSLAINKTRISSKCTTDRFLDALIQEQDVMKFKAIFDDIQVIELKKVSPENVDDIQTVNLEFDFDLYLAQSGFKQSNPGPPNYHISIFKSTEPSPTRESIAKSYLNSNSQTPVLIFYVNESMRLNAFLYRIS